MHAQVGDMAAMVQARARWVVTGTPIGSGGLSDLHGLLRVLQHDPFQDRQLWQACIAKPYARGEHQQRGQDMHACEQPCSGC